MMNIGYFLLLLFCISTNMTYSMDDFMDLTQKTLNPQAQEETYNLLKHNFISSDETSSEFVFSELEDLAFSEKFSSSSDIFSGRAFTTNIPSYPQQPDASNLSISSSSSRGQYPLLTASKNTNDFMDLTRQISDSDTEKFSVLYPFKNIDVLQQTRSLPRQQIEEQQESTNYHSQQPSTESFETVLQQSIPQSLLAIALQSSSKTESPMSSDVKDSTTDDQETLILEQPSSKQRPRKKRKINKDVPDSDYFSIACFFCSPKQPFKSRRKYDLIKMFKKHMEREHSNIIEEEAQTYIGKHLQKPELLFLIYCPESGCGHIAHARERYFLKINLFRHIFKTKQHQCERKNHSKESLATYVENNCKQTLISAQEQLKSIKK